MRVSALDEMLPRSVQRIKGLSTKKGRQKRGRHERSVSPDGASMRGGGDGGGDGAGSSTSCGGVGELAQVTKKHKGQHNMQRRVQPAACGVRGAEMHSSSRAAGAAVSESRPVCDYPFNGLT